MTAPRAAAPTAKTIRLIHASMVTGMLLFAVVGHFVLGPTMANSGDLPPVMLRGHLLRERPFSLSTFMRARAHKPQSLSRRLPCSFSSH